MKQTVFFTLKEDILAVLKEFEATSPVKYVRAGIFFVPDCLSICQGANIPNIGKASNSSAINCESFLVCEPEVVINLRILPPIGGGGERFAVDQLKNTDTITFTPGGVWDNEILLHGRIATSSQSPASQALMKRFHVALKQNSIKIKAFYVGPQALSRLNDGMRLTISAQASREFDLIVP